jgi:hypothetical protein
MARATDRRLTFAGVLLFSALALGSHAQAQASCAVTRADATVWSDLNVEGQVVYYGHVLMYTKDCGLSPADVEAVFTPVTGSPTTCDARGTRYIDEAVCTGGRGAASAGTPMVITASGKSAGTGGADLFRSSCTVVVPHRGRSSCPLPVE